MQKLLDAFCAIPANDLWGHDPGQLFGHWSPGLRYLPSEPGCGHPNAMAGGVKEDGEGPRIVVFGASRYVGRHLFARLGHSASVATYYRRQVPGAHYFDALRMNASDLLDGHPSVKGAVLLLGETDPNRCI